MLGNHIIHLQMLRLNKYLYEYLSLVKNRGNMVIVDQSVLLSSRLDKQRPLFRPQRSRCVCASSFLFLRCGGELILWHRLRNNVAMECRRLVLELLELKTSSSGHDVGSYQGHSLEAKKVKKNAEPPWTELDSLYFIYDLTIRTISRARDLNI